MKTVSMSGSLRKNVGKKDAKAIRKQGNVPCVIYGGEEQIHCSIEAKLFNKVIFTPEVHFIELKIDGKDYNVILQDIQYHPVTDSILHVDFLELIEEKPIIMGIPVILEGTPAGVLQGGRINLKLRKVTIKALPKDLPDNFTLNVEGLEIGDSITISDIEKENLEFMEQPHSVIVNVKVTRVVEEEVGDEDEEGEGEEGEATEGGEGSEGAKSSEKPTA